MFKYLWIALFGVPGISCAQQQGDQKNAIACVWEDEPNYAVSKKVYLDAFVKCYEQIPLDVLKQPSREAMIQWLDDVFEETYADFKTSTHSLWLSAKADGQMVGFLVIDVKKHPEEIYLAMLAIEPACQGLGIASSLIRQVFEEFSGCRRFVVATRRANEEAAGLYRALGFTPAPFLPEGCNPEFYVGLEYTRPLEEHRMGGDFGMNWNEIVENHRGYLPDQSVVLRQYHAFCKSEAPTIVAPGIKEIPVSENNEELIDLRLQGCERINMMPQPESPFEGPTVNSGFPNASKMRASVFYRLQNMVEHLDQLAADFGYAPGQVDILLFEGLRDLSVQKMLFARKMEEILLLNPHMNEAVAERETAKWVSPVRDNIPVHATGAAVDIRLWDNQNQCFLDLGPFGVLWGDSHLAPTFSEGITDVQKTNRLYCLLAAERAGLTNYVYEWWHFSFGDRYDAYWKNSNSLGKVARYGAIE